MKDLSFNILTREVEIKNGDFVLTENPSIQNGGIFEYAKGFNIYNSLNGIGLSNVIGTSLQTVSFEMDRWRQQVKADGATNANFKITIDEILTDVSYL